MNKAIEDCCNRWPLPMYRKQLNGQLSIDVFYVPFGDTLDLDNRWVLFATLMPSDELEEAYAPQFSPTIGAPQSLHAWRLARCSSSSDLAKATRRPLSRSEKMLICSFFLALPGIRAKHHLIHQ